MTGELRAGGDRLAGWRPGSFPTTLAGIERAVVILFIGLRVATLVQMAPALAQGLQASPRPAGYAACAVVAVLSTAAYVVLVIRRDRPLAAVGFGVDIAVAVALLLAGTLVVPVEGRIGTWAGFMPGYATGVLLSGSALQSTAHWLSGLLAVILGHLAFVWAALGPSTLGGAVSGVVAYAALAAVSRAAIRYVLRVGQAADAARAEAAELARRGEEYRARLAMHNGAAIMRLLTEPDLDPEARRGLERQAELEAARMRSYLRGETSQPREATRPATSEVRLAEVVADVADSFVDLPLHVFVELGRSVTVPGATADAVQAALASVLLNVREHAGANEVVVHLDETRPGRWELTVHDDGRGFDTGSTVLGVGLRAVVIDALAPHGVTATVESVPAAGTTVTLRGGVDA